MFVYKLFLTRKSHNTNHNFFPKKKIFLKPQPQNPKSKKKNSKKKFFNQTLKKNPNYLSEKKKKKKKSQIFQNIPWNKHVKMHEVH